MHLPNDIAGLKELVKQLLSRIEALEQENAQLKSQLHQDSHNSHRPPSSEGLSKKPALPKVTKGKQGGQPGHRGKTLQMRSTPDVVYPLQAEACSCGASLAGAAQQLEEQRQVFDLPEAHLVVTEYQRYTCQCPACGASNTVAFPEQLTAPVQYGSGVRALISLLNVSYNLSYEKISQLFADLYGYRLNESTAVSAAKQCYRQLASIEQVSRQALQQGEVNHYDETGLRVAGKLHWLHVCCNRQYTYLFVHQKRGREALEDAASILPDHQGRALHDCWSSYFSFANCSHALCGAHLLRELTALQEAGSWWASHFKRYLLALYHLTNKGTGMLSVRQQQKALRLYARLCAYADSLEPTTILKDRGRPKATKGRNLLNRLLQHQQAVLAFALHPEVPFTNNQAERDLRPTKTKQKVAGCFRTLQGAEIYARIQAFISTLRKQEKNVFQSLKKVINNTFRTQFLLNKPAT